MPINKDALTNARMARFNRLAETHQAKELVEKVLKITLQQEEQTIPRKRVRKADDLKTFRDAITTYLADLLIHADHKESEGYLYRSSNRSGFGDTFMTTTNFDKLNRLWGSMGFLESSKGYGQPHEFDGDRLKLYAQKWAARYRATETALELASEHGITPASSSNHFSIQRSSGPPISLTSDDGKVPSRLNKTDPRTRYQEVADLNAALNQSKTSLKSKPELIRKFNRCRSMDYNFDQGGRLYCVSGDNWQTTHKSERSRITINDEQVVELDIAASQLSILYAVCGKDLDLETDPYKIDGLERFLVKQLIVTMIGKGKQPTRWPRNFKGKYKEETGNNLPNQLTLKAALKKIISKHPILNELITDQLDWGRLQWEESEIMLSTLTRLLNDHSVVALPVYDSILVAKTDSPVAKSVLIDCFYDRLGVTPTIRLSEGTH